MVSNAINTQQEGDNISQIGHIYSHVGERVGEQPLVPLVEDRAALPGMGLHHSDVSDTTILARVNHFRRYCIPSCIIYCGCHVRASEDSQNEVLCQ